MLAAQQSECKMHVGSLANAVGCKYDKARDGSVRESGVEQIMDEDGRGEGDEACILVDGFTVAYLVVCC